MNEKDMTYRMPEGFNPWTSLDAIRGLADAIHHVLLEGAGTKRVMPHGDKAGLNAIAELLQENVHLLHEYFAEIDNSTRLHLPLSDEEFDEIALGNDGNFDGVKETAAVYSIR